MFLKARSYINWSLFAIVMFLAVTPSLPAIEKTLFPIVEDFQVTAWDVREIENGVEWWFRPSITKNRDCEFIGLTWYIGTVEGPFTEVLLRTETDNVPDREPTRPTGYQLLGWWHSFVPEQYHNIRDLQQFGFVTHRCHPIWNTRTILGPIPYYPSTRGAN